MVEIASNRVHLFGGSDSKSADRVQGLTAAGAMFDELTLLPRNFIQQCLARCSVPGNKIFATMNPEGPRHFVKMEYVDRLDEIGGKSFKLLLDDNPSLTADVKQSYRDLFTGAWNKRFIQGEWAGNSGLIFPYYSKGIPRETDIRAWYVSCDYATASTSAFLLFASTSNGHHYLVDAFYHDAVKTGRQLTDVEQAMRLYEFVGNKEVKTIIIDPAAASFILEVRKLYPGRVRKADNDVLTGLRVTDKALQTQRLLISPNCKPVLDEIETYQWDEQKQNKGMDAPIKQYDHAMDAMRYHCMSHFKHISRGIMRKPKHL